MYQTLSFIRRQFYARKLLTVIHQIATAPLDTLRNPAHVAMLVRAAGLNFDLRAPYGSDNAFMNWQSDGLWQNPVQFGKCLAELSKYKIDSFIEIGTSKGWTFSLLTAYLKRFNPNLRAISVDPSPHFRLYKKVRTLLPIEYAVGQTSENFKGQHFDFAFIDGDHSYDWLCKDYKNVGLSAKIAMFHDINDDFVSNKPENNGGVRRFWEELRQTENSSQFHEFIDHSDHAHFMGIGVRINEIGL